MNRHVIIVAGGKGLRMGGDIPKQFLPVGGKPVLMRTIEAFYAFDSSIRRETLRFLPDAALRLPFDDWSHSFQAILVCFPPSCCKIKYFPVSLFVKV